MEAPAFRDPVCGMSVRAYTPLRLEHGGTTYGFWQNHASAVAFLENCVAYNESSHGITNQAGTMTARNCISSTNTGSEFNGAITQSYNYSSDNTASGTGSWTRLTAAQTFKDAGYRENL